MNGKMAGRMVGLFIPSFFKSLLEIRGRVAGHIDEQGVLFRTAVLSEGPARPRAAVQGQQQFFPVQTE